MTCWVSKTYVRPSCVDIHSTGKFQSGVNFQLYKWHRSRPTTCQYSKPHASPLYMSSKHMQYYSTAWRVHVQQLMHTMVAHIHSLCTCAGNPTLVVYLCLTIPGMYSSVSSTVAISGVWCRSHSLQDSSSSSWTQSASQRWWKRVNWCRRKTVSVAYTRV